MSGLSLMELMVAILLGSLLVAGAVKIFTSNTQAFRLQQVVSSAQEGGRLVMEMIQADIRRVGVGSPRNAVGDLIATLRGNNASTAAGVGGLLTASDRLILEYIAPVDMTDCEGNAAPAGSRIVNTYSIANDVAPAIAALFCDGSVNGAVGAAAAPGVALLRGVESFQVNIGVSGDAPVGTALAAGNGYSSALRYVRFGQLGGNRLVSSVRIGLLVRSEQGIVGLPAPANDIRILDTTATAAQLGAVLVDGNRPVHRAFVGTVALRNAVVGAL
ncbi:MAG: PilW family protein [Moraxellaceae bacterium]|nr:PilW family protein [Moraxellaceae bacterium]